MRHLSLSLALSVLALAACGGSSSKPSGKADVAKAIQRLHTANKAAASSTATTSGFVGDEEKTVAGKKGTAKVTTHTEADVSGDGASLKVTHTLVYSGYSTDGVNVFDGTETTTTVQSASGESASQEFTLKGKVTLTGEYETVLDHDVSIVQAVSGTTATLKITGTAAADAASFSFSSESFDVSTSVE